MKKLNVIFTVTLASLMMVTYSCQQMDDTFFDSDTELINAIANAEKQEVTVSDLPTSTQLLIESEFAEDLVVSAQMAPDLGYQLSLVTSSGLELGASEETFFNLSGRLLEDGNAGRFGRRGKRRGRAKCFEFVFPVSFVLPDGSDITLESREDFKNIHTWYQDNPDYTERPDIVFPVDIIYNGDSTATITSEEDWITVNETCQAMREEMRCFSFVFPISVTMADSSIIILEAAEDFSLLREWKEANPDLRGRPELNFPLDVTFDSGETVTINSKEEFREARRSCRTEED